MQLTVSTLFLQFLKHSLFILTIIVVAILIIGMSQTGGSKYLGNVMYYVVSFSATYATFFFLLKNKSLYLTNFRPNATKLRWIGDGIIVSVLGFQIVHYLLLGNIPIVKAAIEQDYYTVGKIRQDIKSVPYWYIKYGAAFIIKAVIPIMMMVFFYKDKRRFFIFAFIGGFYCIALMQKSLIVSAFIPLILSLFVQGKILKSLFIGAFSLSMVVLLNIVANPQLRPGQPKQLDLQAEQIPVYDGLYGRIFLTTGKMVSNWFEYVPDSLPYLNGDGYRFIAPINGNPYREYAREIYDKIYIKEAKMGFTGTATTAHFMYDYANFGKRGLILAGCYLGLFLALLGLVFKEDYHNLFAVNGLFILWLSSAAFTTTLLSGGWVLSILLYIFFKDWFNPKLSSNK